MAKLPTDIKALARAHTESALRVLAGIMNADDCAPAARVTAAQCLLDRGWGKAVQAVELSGEVASKVIRSPQVSDNTQDWSKQHVPEHLRH